MKSLRYLRQSYHQLNTAAVRHVFLQEANGVCSLTLRAPLVSMATSANRRTSSGLPLSVSVNTHNSLASLSYLQVKSYLLSTDKDTRPYNSTQQYIKKIKLPSLDPDTPVVPVIRNIDIITGDIMENTIIGYQPRVSDSLNCSNILKKRKKKMNKHKYKKRIKRDKFKRRQLENIKERKRRVREKAEERAKQSAILGM